MRGVVFLGLAVVVASTDESLLMQQGVGVQSAVTSDMVKSITNSLLDEFKQVQVKDPERRFAVTALLKQVVASGKLEPDEVQVLQQVIGLLNDILALLKDEKTNSQTTINELHSAITGCNTDAENGENESLADNMNGKKADHANCRDEEKALKDAQDAACDALFEFLNAIHTDYCGVKSTTQPILGHVPSWDSFFNLGKSYFNTTYNTFLVLKGTCLDGSSAYDAKKDECDALQEAFEKAFCAWRLDKVLVSNELQSCYNAALLEFEGTGSTERDTADHRTMVGAALEHMICVLQKLIDGDLDNAIADCEFTPGQLAAHQESFNISVPTPDPIYVVDMSGTTILPGTPAFISEHFPNPPEGIAVDPNTGVTCANTTTT